jgi:VanZ family protein
MNKIKELINKIGMDKMVHFFAVAYIALVIALVIATCNPGYPSATYAAWGFIGGFVSAVAKEYADYRTGTCFDLADLAAGVVGAFVSFLIALAVA